MRIRAVLCAVPLLLVLAPAAFGAQGLQLTPDDRAILVSKDVGNERWSIQLSATTGALTGNVFRNAGAPAFVWCDLDDIVDTGNIRTNQWFFSCFAADTCQPGHCPPWTFLRAIQLPGAFFLP